jgi:hypothetical protein
MGITQMKIVVTVAGFVLIFVSGYLLRQGGQHKLSTDLGGSNLSVPAGEQPFNVIVLTLHKLISIALIAYLILNVMRIGRVAPLGQAAWIACIVTAMLFLGALITGALLSAAKNLPPLAKALHKVLPALILLSTAAACYLLLRKE